jgi:hypothetical protein
MRCLRATLLSFTNFLTSIFLTSKLPAITICILIVTPISFAAPQDRILGPIHAGPSVALAKSLHPKVQPQYDMGLVDPARQLSYMTVLMSPSPAQQKALDRLLADQQNPRSANYHKWLTPQQYADRFGLSQNDLAKVITWLQSQGFQIISIGGGRNSVAFSGTVGMAQNAFATEIHNYRVDEKDHFANSIPLKIPSSLSGIVTTVMGLHSFLPHPATRFRGAGRTANSLPDYYDGSFFFPNFLAPDDIATIYDINGLYGRTPAIDGSGQKLAIVGQTDIYLSDINYFRSGFNLPTIPTTGSNSCATDSNGLVISPCNTSNLAYVVVGADLGAPSTCGDLGEADLDVEWSGATARNAQIVYVNSPVAYDINCNYVSGGGVNASLNAVINPPSGPPLAFVVSMSYGDCEAFAGNLETLLQQGNAEGVTILNSSGDTGSAGCDFSSPNSSRPFHPAVYGLAVNYPASSPEVTGVGGTAISLTNDSYPAPSPYWNTSPGPNGGTAVSYIPELVWNDDNELAQFCQSQATLKFCSQGGTPALPGWVALTSTATEAKTQSDIWISQGGGGASNCFSESTSGICLGGFPQPTWQQGLSVPNAPAGVRYVPDVSLLASPDFPGYILCTPQSEFGGGSSNSTCASGIFAAVDTYGSIIGGTSASSPVFAGIVTLLNQYVTANSFQSSPGLGNVNPKLYQIATYNPAAFHPVTSGDILVSCQPGTPAGQAPAILCPASGSLGYRASDADATTGYNLAAGLGSVDVTNLANAWGELFTATTTSLSASPTQIIPGGNVTLTITVTPSSASGVVKLYNNGSTASLGSASISGGTGTFNTTALPLGSNSITGTFVGIFASSTSAPVIVNVIAPDFAVANTSSTSPTVLAGVSATGYTFTVRPVTFGPTFAATVTFACSGLDTTMGCVFNPPSIPAGTSGTQTVALTITTSGPNQPAVPTLQHKRAENRCPWLPLTLPLAGVVMVGLVGRKASRSSGLAMCIMLALLGLFIACGGGSSPPVTVGISPAAASLWPNNAADGWPSSTQAFSASVGNARNTAVNWSISPSTAGSIDANGNYTAPTAAAGLPASVSVTATSQADSSKTATSIVSLKKATVPGTYNATVTVTESVTTHTVGPYTLTIQ